MTDDRSDAEQYERQLIGRNVTAGRIAAKLTQGEVAEAIGVGQHIVSYWERGRRRPSAAYLRRLAVLFERDYGWFFGEHPVTKSRRQKRSRT